MELPQMQMSNTRSNATTLLDEFLNSNGSDLFEDLGNIDDFFNASAGFDLLDQQIMDYNNKLQCANVQMSADGILVYSCMLCQSSDSRSKQMEFYNLLSFQDHLLEDHSSDKLDVGATALSCSTMSSRNAISNTAELLIFEEELNRMEKLNFVMHSAEFMEQIDNELINEPLSELCCSNTPSEPNSTESFSIALIPNSTSNECNTVTQLDIATFESNDVAATVTENVSNSSQQQTSDLSTNDISSSSAKITTSHRENAPTKPKKRRKQGWCEICNRTFNDQYNLRIHKMIHTGEFPFQCEECGKRFRQLNKLQIHRITHTNNKPFICDICDKGFRFRNYLSVHKRLHSGIKPFKCKYCNEHFHSQHTRRLHMKTHNADTKTYACPICDKVHLAQCYLNAHMKRHNNQRDHHCDSCGKSFFSLSQLKDHQLSHTDYKPYECEICHFRFQRKSNYNQHLKIHSSVKSYVCHICKKAFAQNAGLYGHMKSHLNLTN